MTLLALGSWVDAALAQEPRWLQWQPPPECPPGTFIEARVTELLGRPMPPEAKLHVKTSLEWTEDHWEVGVEVAFDGQAGVRTVAVDTCTEAADFVAVAVVLALDPSLAGSMPESAARESMAPAAAPEQAEPEPEFPAFPAQPSSTSETAPTASEPNSAPQRPAFWPSVAVGAIGVVGPLPGPRLGGQLGTGLETDSWCLELLGGAVPSVATSVEGSDPVAFSLWQGRAAFAYLFGGQQGARLGPQLALNVGAIRARQLSAGAQPVWRPWLSVGVGASGSVPWGRFVDLVGSLNLDVPLTQPTFGLDDQSEIYRVSVGVRAELGLRYSFESS